MWRFAGDQGFAIVTKDVDFLELQLLRDFPPKIAWLNCGNVSNGEVRQRLVENAESIAAMLAADNVGVVEIE